MLIAAASTMCDESATTNGSSGSIKSNPSPSSPTKRSPRVFVNTSIPFSVAPQPVKDTIEVAHAKQQFMETFQKIHDAVVAADSEHLNFTLIEDDLNNNLDDQGDDNDNEESARQGRIFSHRGPPHPPPINSPPLLSNFSIFPDPVLEPEYFLPSVHVDPVLINQLHPPLPNNPYIQQIRPISDPRMAGNCYEIILLEPEQELFQLAQQGSQLIPVGTPAFPGLGSQKMVSHFKIPHRPFFSVLHGPLGGPLTPSRRSSTHG
ncbi:hypothetical protein SK128_018102 [Halocaridina rubra]|uniref:Uncharacterized protein n=1 Tax=Halocaridina rubra TaxID=373956 RepID=A0AAN8WYL3_HALRR